jgi:hypothetical protein
MLEELLIKEVRSSNHLSNAHIIQEIELLKQNKHFDELPNKDD